MQCGAVQAALYISPYSHVALSAAAGSIWWLLILQLQPNLFSPTFCTYRYQDNSSRIASMASTYHHGHISLKPMPLASASSLHSGYSDGSYNAVPHYNTPQPDQTFQQATRGDQHLKTSIRILKLISRILATILSATTLAPLIQTLVKYLQTKDVYFTVGGQQRTAWAHDTIAWYTYMYTAVSAVSLLLNLVVLFAYLRGGFRGGNRAAVYDSAWTWSILAVHVVVWVVSAGIYRYGKEPVNGKFRDLWGWTCSTAADELQHAVTNVNFDKYCSVQVRSFRVTALLLSMLTRGIRQCRFTAVLRTSGPVC